MQCVRLSGQTLEVAEIARPSAGTGEILIEVYGAGVTPTELIWYPTTHEKDGTARRNAIPGHEFSGVVAGVGEGASGFAVGDEVYGMNDWFSEGATAEYCVAVPSNIARKPAHLSHAEAASVPIGALTAWQGLFERAKLKAGERVLVHGGAGAVGVFVVQLAKSHGAEVIATASSQQREFLSKLGAKQVIDYAAGPFEKSVRDLDVVFDCVGGDTLERSWSVLRPGGRMVTIAANREGTTDERIKDAFFIVEPKQQQLVEVGKMLDAGKLRTFVDAEVPLNEAAAAYERRVARKHGYGKVVVVTPALAKTMAA
jgi:NADPH:quinone reductase-like Zn-dependent oxidoreductase